MPDNRIDAAGGRRALPRRGDAARHAPRVGRAVLAALGLLALAAPAGAYAQDSTGGTTPTPAEPPESSRARALAPPPTANLYGKPAPRIRRFACRSDCGAAGAARPGSLVRLRGRNVAPLAEVVFLGAPGEADDTSVVPRRVRARSLLARVPRTAASGPIALVRADGTRSPASARPLTIEPYPVDVPAGMIDAEVQGSKVFFGARRPAELSYVVGGSRPATVQVELVRAADGAVVAAVDAGRGRAGRRADRPLGRHRRRRGPARRRLPVPRHGDRRSRASAPPRARPASRERWARRARAPAAPPRSPPRRPAPSRSCATASRSSARTTTPRRPRASAAAAATRARTCSPRAARRSSPRAAAS